MLLHSSVRGLLLCISYKLNDDCSSRRVESGGNDRACAHAPNGPLPPFNSSKTSPPPSLLKSVRIPLIFCSSVCFMFSGHIFHVLWRVLGFLFIFLSVCGVRVCRDILGFSFFAGRPRFGCEMVDEPNSHSLVFSDWRIDWFGSGGKCYGQICRYWFWF